MALITPFLCTDQPYPFSTLRKQMASLTSPGIVHAGDMAVSPSSGLQVQISAGEAYVQQTGATEGTNYNGVYYELNDAPANPFNTISAPLVNPRIDMVILRIYDVTELGIGGSSFARFEWVQGSENASASLATMGPGLSNPGAGTIPASSLLRAYVLQTVGESSISSGNILNVAPIIGNPGFSEGTLALRPAAGLAGRDYYATDAQEFYRDNGAVWCVGPRPNDRGASNIATSQSTSSTTYTTLATPDQVTGIVLPANGLITVWYQATWQESVSGAARAALFLGANQLVIASNSGATIAQAATLGGTAALNAPLFTNGAGLSSFTVPGGYGGDVTTGQLVGGTASTTSGYGAAVFAAAGTYTVSVQFKASSGTVTASNRKLWVQAIPFS